MRIVVIGSGGREHALLWKFSRSGYSPTLFAMPGNVGMEPICKLVPVDGSVQMMLDKVLELGPDLVVVGPEQPLANGLSEHIERRGIRCFGPSADAAMLESSKVFAKELMRANAIPTAEFEVFSDFYALSEFVQNHPRETGRVIKADGLASGKGAFVCDGDDLVLEIAHRLLVDHALGLAGARVIVEEKLVGREASLHFFCDGERFVALPTAQDYKRAFDADQGPNTGGMGTFCPARHVNDELLLEIERRIVAPTLGAMAVNGMPYRGLLYVGVMLTDDGPQVIEYNCRFGDPETQVMLPCLAYDPIDAMIACVDGALDPSRFSHAASGAAVCVVLCANGYPDHYDKGIPLVSPHCDGQQLLFSAGTTNRDGKWVSNGGRVLNAVGLGVTVSEARHHAYELAHRACVPGLRIRGDIAISEVE
ncbi:MAG: phosphoribosylamine--glycine ligase [bacterium]|nr:phosphoribosylamine--glycine ligase [bacterium]